MTILDADIKLLASQVLADVPEGGGAATGHEVADGVSNNLFNDVSELDRVYGDVALRKVFVGIDTANRDAYFGANLIVAKPPADPDVSAVLFNTADSFDTRTEAASRIESYLAQGSAYQGLLFGNHIAGQMTVTLIQRTSVGIPSPGDTILLRKNEGLVSQVEQYVRVVQASATDATFTDLSGDFVRTVVVLNISDQLRDDFPGFDAVRLDASISYTSKTKTYNTLVADAARYYGIAPLAAAATANDFTVNAASIFAQLVPSSRAETPVADARLNQQVGALTALADTPVVQTFTLAFSTTQNLFIGGGILPGSLSISSGGVTLVDLGGTLRNASNASVGQVDYGNGVLSLTSNVFGTASQTFSVAYQMADAPTTVTDSIGIAVKAATQRLTYVVTLSPAPARASLQVSYRAQGRWYVLQEDGSGAIRGADTSLGAGTLNFATGTVSLTLGALPDVGGYVILSYARSSAIGGVTPSMLANGGKVFAEFDMGTAIKPGSISLSWTNGAAKSATDNGAGALTGDAGGLVYYSSGRIQFVPAVIPPVGTVISVSINTASQQDSTVATLTDGGTAWTTTVATPVRAGSLVMSVVSQYNVLVYPGVDAAQSYLQRVHDDAVGGLVIDTDAAQLTVGSIDYSTGAVSINKSVPGFHSLQNTWVTGTSGDSIFGTQSTYYQTGPRITRTLTLSFLNGSASALAAPPWAWFTGGQTVGAVIRYSGADVTTSTQTFALTALKLTSKPTLIAKVGGINYTVWGVVRFMLGGESYFGTASSGTLRKTVVPTTGEATQVGTQIGYTSTLTTWPANIDPAVTNMGGTQTVETGDGTDLASDGVVFRTSAAPLVPGAFSIVGTLADGTTFNVTADEDGVINAASVVGTVDYETGVVSIRFGAADAGPASLGVVDATYLGIAGVNFIALKQARIDSLRYNAVAYSYLPLDASILGLDPVRLPSDGRVPIFRSGTVAVVHHTATTTPAVVSNGQTINCARIRLSRVRVIGSDGVAIDSGYTADLVAGTVTFSDVSGYSQPVHVEHRIEDMALVTSAQITGAIALQRPVTHDYPLGSYVSSALLIGDLFARVSSIYDQATWTSVWSDDLIGSAASASFDAINYPPVVTNDGAVNERWALVFTGGTNFNIVGEHFGLIGTGNTAADVAPLNPATGQPYFTLNHLGFGSGWSAGNALRITTAGALAPVWVARVVKQGVATTSSDSFTLATRGDIDTP